MSVSIKAVQLRVQFPIYNAPTRSLKKAILRTATGGRIGADHSGRVCVRALDQLSFDMSEGDRVGLVGQNGSGKTTLLRVIAGVYEPTEGHIAISGRVASLLDISMGLEPEATGYENIVLRGLMMGVKPKEIRRKVDDIAEFSELGDYLGMPLRTYSSGMVMRLAFSVSTNIEPEILIMDEWLSVGDANFVEKAENRLQELLKKTPILVIASHSPDLISKLCNKVMKLANGRLLAIEKPVKKEGEGEPNKMGARAR